MLLSDLIPYALGDRPKELELCDLMEHNPEPIVYTLVISRKIMTAVYLRYQRPCNSTFLIKEF
jgi:hypothetical protein